MIINVPTMIFLLGQRSARCKLLVREPSVSKYSRQSKINPSFMQSIFSSRNSKHPSRNLKSFSTKSSYFWFQSLKAIGPRIWNCLPNEIKLSINKVQVSAAQSFCKVLDCISLVKPIQIWKQGEKDNFLIITRWLSMNRTFIIFNKILLSTKALNCNFQSSSFGLYSFILLWVAPHMIGSFIWRKSTLNITLNPILLFTRISLAARLSFSPETEEKLDQLSVERSYA